MLELTQAPLVGLVQDLSTRGLCLQLASPVTPNSLVQIEVNGVSLLGCVRHIRLDKQSYVVGVQLQHSIRKLDQLREYNRLVLEEAKFAECQKDIR